MRHVKLGYYTLCLLCMAMCVICQLIPLVFRTHSQNFVTPSRCSNGWYSTIMIHPHKSSRACTYLQLTVKRHFQADGAIHTSVHGQGLGSHRKSVHLQSCCVLLCIRGEAGISPGLVLNNNYLSQVIQPQFVDNPFDPDTLQPL